ncbi:MAG: ABC transporter ATP-binding protein [Thermoanaerobacteraceae bacterium]|jgi:branched-chain amino acid transport system ATP-binding protein|nr:ABC transporter ATP-binding protein [Thermoanaerobacteraceae bacterium]
MLKIKNLTGGYDKTIVLRDVSIELNEGEFVGVVGANGGGKSTLLRLISGLATISSGTIECMGTDLTNKTPYEIVDIGVVHVPEGRGIFPYMSVKDNLLVGSYTNRAKTKRKESIEFVLDFFPKLEQRLNQMAGTLSGGEQQMLAVARALMSCPRVLMLDEPSLGLAPKVVMELFEKMIELNRKGLTILLVEQNVKRCLELVQRAYVIENGSVIKSGVGKELLGSEDIKKAYLGI